MNGKERTERKAAKNASTEAIRQATLRMMQKSKWEPERVKQEGNSQRYRVTHPVHGSVIVAIKLASEGTGWMGFAQKVDGEFHSPLTNSDFILYATPYEGQLGVWMFPMAAVLERLEAIQTLYDERNWGRKASLWVNIFERPDKPPMQGNLAEGAPPMWRMPLPPAVVAVDEDPADEPIKADEGRHMRSKPEPGGLSDYTVGQLIDELRARGLKSFTWG